MRKMTAGIIAAAMALSLTGCGEIAEIGMSNVTSNIYSDEEMDSFVASITKTLDTWDSDLESVRYLGDDMCNDEEILTKLNEERSVNAPKYTECIGFSVDYRDSMNPLVLLKGLIRGRINCGEVDDCQWWFARTDDGYWETAYTGQIDIREQP